MSSAAPVAPTAAPAPAPVSTTSTPAPTPIVETPSADPYDRIFEKHEQEFLAPKAEGEQEAEVKPIEAKPDVPVEQTPEQKADAELEAKLPGKFREAIKDIKDSKVRKALAADHFKAKALTESGLRIGELRERAIIAPTLEIAQHHKAVYDNVVALDDSFRTATPEGQARFVESLQSGDPKAFKALMETSFMSLPKSHPDLAKRYSDHIGRSQIAWARQRAAESGDADLAAAADIWEANFKLGAGQPPVEENQAPEDPRLRKLEEMERQEAQRTEVARQQFFDSAYNVAGTTAFGEITKWADVAFPNANREGKAWVVEQVGRSIYNVAWNDRDLGNTIKDIYMATGNSEEGRQAIARTVLNFIRQKSPAIRAAQGKRFNDMTRAERVKHEEQTTTVLARKDVGGGGVVTKIPQPPKTSPKGRSMDDVLDEFERLNNLPR